MKVEIEKKIEEMEVGEVGYAVPWSIYFVEYKSWFTFKKYFLPFIKPNHMVMDEKQGTASVKVMMKTNGVWVIPTEKYKFHKAEDRSYGDYNVLNYINEEFKEWF